MLHEPLWYTCGFDPCVNFERTIPSLHNIKSKDGISLKCVYIHRPRNINGNIMTVFVMHSHGYINTSMSRENIISGCPNELRKTLHTLKYI